MTAHAFPARTNGRLERLAPSPNRPNDLPSATPVDRPPTRGLLRIQEAADWLGLSRRKVYELISRGELPSVCIGRSRRIAQTALESFVERLPMTPGDGEPRT